MLVLLAMTLAGCKRSPTPTPTPIATIPAPDTRSSGAQVAASGEIVPSQETHLGFPVPGRVETVTVKEGDRVEAGQVLLVLETDLLEADVVQAEAALAIARAQVALLKAGPRLEEVAVAEAQLAVAQTSVAEAEVQQTMPDLGATQAEIRAAQAQVAAAMADHLVAEEYHELTLTCVDVKLGGGRVKTICPVLGPIEEQARYGMEAANQAQASVQAQLDALLAGANAEVRPRPRFRRNWTRCSLARTPRCAWSRPAFRPPLLSRMLPRRNWRWCGRGPPLRRSRPPRQRCRRQKRRCRSPTPGSTRRRYYLPLPVPSPRWRSVLVRR
jgi:multidrug efflux pump subunit AcrA (membrane-fusion protein)